MTWPLTYINCANTNDVILLLPSRIFTENAFDGISLGSIRYVFQQLYFILPAEALTGKLFNGRHTILMTTRCLEPNVIQEGETPPPFWYDGCWAILSGNLDAEGWYAGCHPWSKLDSDAMN